ncbi:Putative uncharacterized protein FLJ37770, partial [Habropoda laboriosa]
EQRYNIKFYVKLGKTASETRAQTFRWFKRFNNGRNDIEDDARSGRLRTTSNPPELVGKVRDLLKNDASLTHRMIADEFEADKESIRSIITRKLGKRKVCAKFVLHLHSHR